MPGFHAIAKWLVAAALLGGFTERRAPAQVPGEVNDPLNAPGGNARKPGTIRFEQMNLNDASLNRVAGTFLAPAGWKSEGGVMWFNSPFHPARPWMRSFNPKGLEQLTVYPMYDMFAGIRRVIPSQARFWPEGSYYSGSEVRDVIANPGDFLRQVVIPRQRKDIREAKVLGYEDLPKLADAIARSPVARSVANLELRAGRLVVTHVYEDINDMRRQSFEYRGRVTSDANRRFCEAIRGVNSYVTPFENYPVQLPNGYNYAWTSGSGQYVMSNDPGYIPGQHFNGTWQPIQQAP